MRSTPEQREYREKLRSRILDLNKSGKTHDEIARLFTKEKLKRLSGAGNTWTKQDVGYLLYQTGDARRRATVAAVSPPTSNLEELMRAVMNSKDIEVGHKTDLMKILLTRG